MRLALRRTLLLSTLALALAGGAAADEASDKALLAKAKHKALLGQPVPDFKAEYPVNGKVTGLGALKGKIVLLAFCRLQLGTSRKALPYMQEWYDKHKADKLEVILVPFYDDASPHRLGYDQERKRVYRSSKITRQGEEEMLGVFATAHQLTFPLLKLPPEELRRIGSIYWVTITPEFVVIDPKGVVRLVRVGSSDGALNQVQDLLEKLIEAAK